MNAVKPIRTRRDYESAMKAVERLWGARAGTPDGDRLDVLATLIDAYEAEHYPMDPPDPIEAIKFRMEQKGLTRKDLAKILGTRTRVSEVLNRRRKPFDRNDSTASQETRNFGGGADPPDASGKSRCVTFWALDAETPFVEFPGRFPALLIDHLEESPRNTR